MSKITVQKLDGSFQVFAPSNSRRWIKFRVSPLGCEIAEYEDVGNGEVKKYTLASFKEYQWVTQDKAGLEAETVKTELTTIDVEPELDPFTQAELEDHTKEDIDYTKDLITPKLGTLPEEVHIASKGDGLSVAELYNAVKKQSDENAPKGECKNCGSDFVKNHHAKKFCNTKCKDQFHNKKVKHSC